MKCAPRKKFIAGNFLTVEWQQHGKTVVRFHWIISQAIWNEYILWINRCDQWRLLPLRLWLLLLVVTKHMRLFCCHHSAQIDRNLFIFFHILIKCNLAIQRFVRSLVMCEIGRSFALFLALSSVTNRYVFDMYRIHFCCCCWEQVICFHSSISCDVVVVVVIVSHKHSSEHTWHREQREYVCERVWRADNVQKRDSPMWWLLLLPVFILNALFFVHSISYVGMVLLLCCVVGLCWRYFQRIIESRWRCYDLMIPYEESVATCYLHR